MPGAGRRHRPRSRIAQSCRGQGYQQNPTPSQSDLEDSANTRAHENEGGAILCSDMGISKLRALLEPSRAEAVEDYLVAVEEYLMGAARALLGLDDDESEDGNDTTALPLRMARADLEDYVSDCEPEREKLHLRGWSRVAATSHLRDGGAASSTAKNKRRKRQRRKRLTGLVPAPS